MANTRRRPGRSADDIGMQPAAPVRDGLAYPHMLLSAPPPRSELCTVEFAAEQLKLHAKTVLRFIREGRLRATRVGKSYRILRSDLDAFAGVPARPEPPASEAWVTSIVDVPGIGPDLAKKWARTITNAVQDKPVGAAMRADVTYEPDRSLLKIILIGTPRDTINLLSLIQIWLERLRT
jgi:excisionase family DNA binding protein